MFRRPLILMSVLAAAIGVPYVALDEQVKGFVRAQLARWPGDSESSQADPLAKIDGLLKPMASTTASAPGMPAAAASPATVPLEESIRFDVTPEWVTLRWPQVTSVIGDSEHLGLRVMLVSGTSPSDVAGALTYYFDQEHRVERITLDGVTGEPSRLVNYTVGRFGLRPTQTKEPGLFYSDDPNEPTSMLRLAALPIVRPEAPLARVHVTLDLKRTDVARIKSEEQPAKVHPSSYRRW
ncbi:MAG: hypothetical protein L0211_24965 [Planctomycetaceae bacterium]|nr:hypothetical protein [Planctomycetaceae bacterium]